MKKKDVLINIKGIYSESGDNDTVELFTTGVYYSKGGNYYISYDETEATGFEGSKTTLMVEKESKVTLQRKGKANSQLIVENGVRHQCHYDVGYGELMIGVLGSSIKSSLDDQGGNLSIKYSLDINTFLTSENEMHIFIKEQ